ncbi:ATP12 family chaperone protein [Bartonella sp. DGB2]|uniref:ATP12 family chaperone protein n=1 Tax=Bartonella sp. DGB2 TaxID=3388426 RepID=UPI0039902457
MLESPPQDKASIDEMPVQKVQKLAKRFYKEVWVIEKETGFLPLLDGHIIKTPARKALTLPNEALAQTVAQEFVMQGEYINPVTMPITRLVNTVIDRLDSDPQPIFEDILDILSTDMLFYRAQAPQELLARQRTSWDPILDWAKSRYGAVFFTGKGIMHIEQPPNAIQAMRVLLESVKSPYALAALHMMTTLMGSALLTLATYDGAIAGDEAWALAHLDEDWTIEHWGADEEALRVRIHNKKEFYAALQVMNVARSH